MTQEDKDLLLKDLCARLPYGTLVYAQNAVDWYEDEINTQVLSDAINEEYVIKPYLFPLSSMTKEQESYLHFNTKFRLDICNDLTVKNDEDDSCFYTDTYDYISLIDWLNKNHFDYRGLILKGLALDATGLNIY